MVNLKELKKTFQGKRVFLSGHTGFKGAWMLQILHLLGAEVKGYALAPEQDGDLYHLINGDKLCHTSVIADICDKQRLETEVVRFEPDFVFHFAAQALVRRGYELPSYTFMVNAQGTAHMLDAIRALQKPCIGVMITTDKVYENPERGLPFQEDDKLGGYDPYSASKAAAEVVIDSYRRSFFNPEAYSKHHKAIAAARAGNVIGGGDFSPDRIIPDIVRAIHSGNPVGLRNPASVRPWQHVLEPLGAYLALAAGMVRNPTGLSTAFNFGPDPADLLSVEELTKIFIRCFGEGSYIDMQQANAPHEAKLLLLDSSKAGSMLDWYPKMDATRAIEMTANWYADRKTAAREKCTSQIEVYFRD